MGPCGQRQGVAVIRPPSPCWRPSPPLSAASVMSPADPDTSPAHPVSPKPASAQCLLEAKLIRGLPHPPLGNPAPLLPRVCIWTLQLFPMRPLRTPGSLHPQRCLGEEGLELAQLKDSWTGEVTTEREFTAVPQRMEGIGVGTLPVGGGCWLPDGVLQTHACLQYSRLRSGLPHPWAPPPRPPGPAPSYATPPARPGELPSPALPPTPNSPRPTSSFEPAPFCQASPRPLRTWLPRDLASGQGPQRCFELSADWPGPAGRGVVSIGKEGSALPAWHTAEGRGGHSPGQRASQSGLLRVCGETGHGRAVRRSPPKASHLPAFTHTVPSAERVLGVSSWKSLVSPHPTLL